MPQRVCPFFTPVRHLCKRIGKFYKNYATHPNKPSTKLLRVKVTGADRIWRNVVHSFSCIFRYEQHRLCP